MKKPLFLIFFGTAALLFGQGGALDPADLLKPLTDNWTSYSGDYSGRRYSFLKQVTAENVKGLSMEWVNTGITSACGPGGTAAATGAPAAAGGAESVERVDNAESPATKPTPPFKMARRFGRHSIGTTIFPSDVGSETAWQMILRGGNVGEEFASRRTGMAQAVCSG